MDDLSKILQTTNMKADDEVPKISINLDDMKDKECDICKHTLYRMSIVFYKISSLVSGSGKTEIIPIPCVICSNCNSVIIRLGDKNQLPNNAQQMKCNCGNESFDGYIKFKIIPGILTGSSRDGMKDTECFLCSKCRTELEL